MKFFLAGIMQGSHQLSELHQQDYRPRLRELLERHVSGAEVYDPLADHADSLQYDDLLARRVFFTHNRMCRKVDAVIAFVPEASMGSAIEMWEAYRHRKIVITISPMQHNWTIRYCSHLRYSTVAEFEEALTSGRLEQQIAALREELPRSTEDFCE